MFSDGVSKNMDTQDYINCLSHNMDGSQLTNPKASSKCIAHETRLRAQPDYATKQIEMMKSQDRCEYNPTSKKYQLISGKMKPKADDVTIICA